MAVAKRQRRGKPIKIEQRKVRGPELGPQVKQTALLASPIYLGLAQGEEKKAYKKRSQNWAGAFSSRLLGQSTIALWEGIFLSLPIKLSSNTGPSVASNALQWDRTEEITHSPNNFILIQVKWALWLGQWETELSNFSLSNSLTMNTSISVLLLLLLLSRFSRVQLCATP